MNKKLVFFVLILFIIGLVGDQVTTRLYYKKSGDEEKQKDEIDPNPDIPMIKPPSLFDQNPLKIPTIKSNTWMVYDAIIACFACLVTFALVSKSDDNESIKIVTIVFIFLILLSATLKLMNMLTHITSMY